MIGALLLITPAIMGVGYEYVDQALNGGLLARTMVLLCALKLVATIVSYASGNAGGIFAPSLYIGAMAGGAVGMLVHRVAPFPTADPGAYALVGMGTLFAGIIRAPMTSVFMIFEITQDYQILVPLMVANLLSFTISKRYQPLPLYHALLQQDDVHLPSSSLPNLPEGRTAADMMSGDLPIVSAHTPIRDALSLMGGSTALIVRDGRSAGGVVGRERLADTDAAGHGAEPVSSIAVQPDIHVHPDHPFDVVLERFPAAEGTLPVVSRADASWIEGVITLDSIMAAVAARAPRPPAG
jgi:CIC family chloride channel protein